MLVAGERPVCSDALTKQVEKPTSIRSPWFLIQSRLEPPLSAKRHRKVRHVGRGLGRADLAELLAHWQPTVIKGNAGEIGAMAESTEVCPVKLPYSI